MKRILPLMDFSGGLNVETSNEKLQDNELTIAKNADLSNRGSFRRRTGRKRLGSIPGKGQGMFFYYRSGQPVPDILVAVSGRLYHLNNGVPTEIVITDGKNEDGTDKVFTFQAEKTVEAAQTRETLIVATGTKLVEVTYDTTWKAETVKPYKPTVMEVINIGTNAIASDPATWIQEKEASVVSIEGITASIAEGGVNDPVRFTAHVMKPANVNVKYSFSWRKTGSGTFNYVASSINQNYTDLTFQDIGAYDIKAETKRFDYIIDKFDESENYTNAIKGGRYDSYGGEGSLVLQGSTTNPEDATLKAWADLSTPLDLSKGNTVEWSFTVYSSSTSSGLDPGAVQMKFYAEGDLITPVLTINNSGGQGRGIYIIDQINSNPAWVGSVPASIAWRKETTNYDGSITGLDKIVRVGFSGDCVSNTGVYFPADGSDGWNIWYEDTTSRFDEIIYYQTGTEVSYTKTDYQVVGVKNPVIDPETYKEIHTSRAIRLHHDRIILAKDNKYPGQIYVSDLNNPRYFPTNKRLDFSLDRKEGITTIKRFKDFLVIFTKTTISLLLGRSPGDGDVPGDYEIKMIHDRIGCIAERSAEVVGNEILFLGDDGLYTLRPNDYQLNDLNVQRIDDKIKSLVPHDDKEACAMFYDNQYWICFPSTKEIFRLYYQTGAWAQDVSTKLNISQFLLYTDNVMELTLDGTIYEQDESFTDDGEIYALEVQSKYFDLAATFHYKRMKRLFVMARHYKEEHVPLYIRVWSDAQLVLNPAQGEAVVQDGYVVWQTKTEPTMNFYSHAVLGQWELGKSLLGEPDMSILETSIDKGKGKRVRVGFTHQENGPCEVIGYGLEYKVTKP